MKNRIFPVIASLATIGTSIIVSTGAWILLTRISISPALKALIGVGILLVGLVLILMVFRLAVGLIYLRREETVFGRAAYIKEKYFDVE